jgi:hypothetical protein
MTEKIVEKLRQANENEFFFTHHENIGNSEEFARLMQYINKNSNIKIIKVDAESLRQMRSNGACGSFNLQVIKNEEE